MDFFPASHPLKRNHSRKKKENPIFELQHDFRMSNDICMACLGPFGVFVFYLFPYVLVTISFGKKKSADRPNLNYYSYTYCICICNHVLFPGKDLKLALICLPFCLIALFFWLPLLFWHLILVRSPFYSASWWGYGLSTSFLVLFYFLFLDQHMYPMEWLPRRRLIFLYQHKIIQLVGSDYS